MPTTVTTPIGTGQSGGLGVGAATPQAWANLLAGLILTTADQIQRGALLNQEFTSSGLVLDMSAISVATDVNRYVELTTAAGAAWNDNAAKRTNPYYYDGTKGAGLRNTSGGSCIHLGGAGFIKLTNLQISGAQEAISVDTNVGGTHTISNCIIQGGDILFDTNSFVIMNNSLIVSTTPRFNRILVLVGGNNITLNYCDVVVPNGVSVTNILDGQSGTSTLAYKNCGLFGATALATAAGSVTTTYDHCATNLATMAGTANLTSLSYTAQFRNFATDFAIASASTMRGAGTPITTPTALPNDATGILRNATTPDIGAWEFAAASGGATSPGFVKFGPFLGIAAAEEWLRRRKEQVRRDEG